MNESSQEQRSAQSSPSNESSGTPGIDSIQGGTIPTTSRTDSASTSGTNEQKSKTASSEVDAQNKDAKQKKTSASQKSRPSSQTETTGINSDNNGPIHNGDTAG